MSDEPRERTIRITDRTQLSLPLVVVCTLLISLTGGAIATTRAYYYIVARLEKAIESSTQAHAEQAATKASLEKQSDRIRMLEQQQIDFSALKSDTAALKADMAWLKNFMLQERGRGWSTTRPE